MVVASASVEGVVMGTSKMARFAHKILLSPPYHRGSAQTRHPAYSDRITQQLKESITSRGEKKALMRHATANPPHKSKLPCCLLLPVEGSLANQVSQYYAAFSLCCIK